MNKPQERPFVDVRNLRVTFTGGKKPVEAVNGVDLQVKRGEVVALIGESGSGKSVTLRSLLRLHPPGRSRIEGQMRVGEQDVLALGTQALADYRGKIASMIFQEPLLALDPVYSVGAQIVESVRRHDNVSAAEAHQRALPQWQAAPEVENALGKPAAATQHGQMTRDIGHGVGARAFTRWVVLCRLLDRRQAYLRP